MRFTRAFCDRYRRASAEGPNPLLWLDATALALVEMLQYLVPGKKEITRERVYTYLYWATSPRTPTIARGNDPGQPNAAPRPTRALAGYSTRGIATSWLSHAAFLGIGLGDRFKASRGISGAIEEQVDEGEETT
jgi:hypothetical protein